MPIALVIIAHAPLASALKSCALHVYACDSDVDNRIHAFDVIADANFQAIADTVSASLPSLVGDEILVLTDIIGATPCNIATSLLKHSDVSVLTGVNLAMVLTALCHQKEDLKTVTSLVREAGCASILQTIGSDT